MSLTDEHIYKFIREKNDEGITRITLQDIAAAIGCHRNTAWNATERLLSAGRIRKASVNGRESTYEAINNA